MNALTNKTSSQAFFLRVLKVIIQLREAALQSIKRAKHARDEKAKKAAAAAAKAATAAVATTPSTEEAAAAASAAPAVAETSSEAMEVDDEELAPAPPAATAAAAASNEGEPEKDEFKECLESLSEQLDLTPLWETLSSCLRDLADTPDHHAVLVLQVNPYKLKPFFQGRKPRKEEISRLMQIFFYNKP